MEWYKAGIESSRCHKVPLQTGREILVCIGEAGGQGSLATELYVEDLLNPTATLMAEDESPFFGVVDTIFTCGYDYEDKAKASPVTRAFIERVKFSTATPSALSVDASYGWRATTPEVAKACVNSGKPAEFAPPVKSYHLDFVFDGHTYQPTAASAETARMFESR